MKTHIVAMIVGVLLVGSIAPGTAADDSQTNRVGFDPAIEKYVHFLEKQHQSPVDYILRLFEKNDLVVLCERFHAETTQYDLIYRLVSDARFCSRIGVVYTEVGTCALRPVVESFLLDDTLTEAQVQEKLRYIAQNFDFEPVWEKTNIFEFLRKLHYLNCSLAPDRRVRLYPSGIEFSWQNMTAEKWREFRKELGRRDQIMAQNIIEKCKELHQTQGRTKALVIMNYRHAFPHLESETGRRVENTTGFLMEAFPGRVANVMINSVGLLNGTTDQRVLLTAIQEGKWDAAFAVLHNPSVAFDFRGSPLGEDTFDYFPFIPHHLRCQDVFTGFVFFKPLNAHCQSFGLPGLIDASFEKELQRRMSIAGNPAPADITQEIKKLETAHVTYGYDDPAMSKKVQQWLSTKP